MSPRLSAFLSLAGALLLLASVYLPWQEGAISIDGWESRIGDVVALSCLAVLAAAVAALVRGRATGLALAPLALAAGYFGVALAIQSRAAAEFQAFSTEAKLHYAYGAYLGLVGSAALLTAAVLLLVRRDGFSDRAAASAIVLGLLIAFLLPWEHTTRFGGLTSIGIERPGAVAAAAVAIMSAFVWQRGRVESTVGAAAAAVATGGALTMHVLTRGHAYGAWLAVGLAVGLVLLSLVRGGAQAEIAHLHQVGVVAALAAVFFVVALFLTWQRDCPPDDGGCFSINGWSANVGVAAGLIAIALAALLVMPSRDLRALLALVLAFGLFVATLGIWFLDVPLPEVSSGSGAWIGFVAAAVLIAAAAARVRPWPLSRSRVLPRLGPIAACASYVALILVPSWRVLPDGAQAALWFPPLSWLTIAGVVIAIHLLSIWGRRAVSPQASRELLPLLPLALLALTAIDLIRARNEGISWGGGIVVGLCVLLAALGWVEQRQGLESIRVPDLLRVDRI